MEDLQDWPRHQKCSVISMLLAGRRLLYRILALASQGSPAILASERGHQTPYYPVDSPDEY